MLFNIIDNKASETSLFIHPDVQDSNSYTFVIVNMGYCPCASTKGIDRERKRKKTKNWLWQICFVHGVCLGVAGVKRDVFWPVLWLVLAAGQQKDRKSS